MSYGDALLYYKCISHLQAEEMLNDITTGSAHSMTKNGRKNLHKQLEALKFKEDMPVVTMENFVRKLSNG